MSAEQLNRKIIDRIDEGVVVLENGTITQVNAAIEKMTGMGRAELMRLPLSQLLDPAPPLYSQPAPDVANAEHQKPLMYESSLTVAGGQSLAVAVSVHTVQEGEGDVQFLIVRDIAERKKMQQDLVEIAPVGVHRGAFGRHRPRLQQLVDRHHGEHIPGSDQHSGRRAHV